MFTDEPVTPARVETLVELLRRSRYQFDRQKLGAALQPGELPDVGADAGRVQAAVALRAAVELRLVDDEGPALRTAFAASDRRSTRELVLAAIDDHVLRHTEVEPYFAPFYAWTLGLGRKADAERSREEWAVAFETDAFGGRSANNPFNAVKHLGLHRWYAYAGLGWYDPQKVFQANPYDRLARALPVIFAGQGRLSGDEFMDRLAAACPELDGGAVFTRYAQGWSRDARTCTLGLSHALVDLHAADRIVLTCTRDSAGWSIAAAAPPMGGSISSSRIDYVEMAGDAR